MLALVQGSLHKIDDKKVNKYLIIFLYLVTIYIVQQQIINNIHEAVLTLRNVFSSVYFQGEDSWS